MVDRRIRSRERKGAVYKFNTTGSIIEVLRTLLDEENALLGKTPEEIIIDPKVARLCRRLMKKTLKTNMPTRFIAPVIRGGKEVQRSCLIEKYSDTEIVIISSPDPPENADT